MKHIYLLVMLGLGCGSFKPVKAQVQGFENWVTRTEGVNTWDDPQGWYTLNSLTKFGFPATTTASSDFHSGSKSALLETTKATFGTIPGLLTLGNMLDDTGEPDLMRTYIPFQGRPQFIRFWAKTEPETGDSVAMLLQLRKTLNNGAQVIVGTAGWTFGDYSNGWIKVEIPIDYENNEMPDSISILFASSRDESAPIAGSRFWVDDVELEGLQVGQKEWSVQSFSLYPNPATNKLYVEGRGIEGVKVYDLQGQLLMDVSNKFSSIDINLPAGQYLVQPYSSTVFYSVKPLIIN